MQGANGVGNMAKAMSMAGGQQPGGPEKIDNLSKYPTILTFCLFPPEAKMSNFELDNRISKIVSEKLNELKDRLESTKKET